MLRLSFGLSQTDEPSKRANRARHLTHRFTRVPD
ncbi:hypothetical protein HD593_002389 [Nonomuraea rubra]|uniref:Uncharacterized protein n=1 Tax=Nonomuraea rubra TaxID=46180 RepID=A0A7X0NQC6_9ACTN|nr:hypothetical protein [Nonomuraea rubra]